MCNKNRKLYIIGNGFDLAHDLPTKYADFRDWLKDVHYEIEKNNDYTDFMVSMEQIFAHSSYNDGSTIELWSDFENALGNLQIDQFIKKVADDNAIQDPEDEYYNDPGYLANQVHNFVEQIYMQHALEYVRSLFREWILNIPNYDDIEPCFTIEDIETEGLFLTFNYTNTLETVYNIQPEQILHIHGCIFQEGSEIIVGHENMYNRELYNEIEEELFGVDVEIFPMMVEVMNGLRKNTKQIIQQNKDWFENLKNQGIKEIYLYGLSFGEIDDAYYKEIYEQIPDAHWIFAIYAETKGIERSNVRNIRNFIDRIGIPHEKCRAFDQDVITHDEIELFN